MTIFKRPRSPYWHYDFRYGKRRYQGSTKTFTERDAEAIERAVRERVIKTPHVFRGNGRPKSKLKSRLYVIYAGGTTRFKIGISSKPNSRLSDLKVGSCMPLELVLPAQSARRSHFSKRNRGVCDCCVARALAFHAATLAEDTVGSDAAIEIFEYIISELRENDTPAPPELH